MSRKRRNMLGLDIVCHVHPGEVLLPLRIRATSGALEIAGPRDRGVASARTGVFHPGDPYKWSVTCGRPAPNGRRCTVHPQYGHEGVNHVMTALVSSGETSIVTVSDLVMQGLVHQPLSAVATYFTARRATIVV